MDDAFDITNRFRGGDCAPSACGAAVSDDTARAFACVFKALGDPTRVRLVSVIAGAPESEACICDLTAAVGLSQSTVSHHMKRLVEAGLVARDKRGKWAYFRMADDALTTVIEAADQAISGPASAARVTSGG